MFNEKETFDKQKPYNNQILTTKHIKKMAADFNSLMLDYKKPLKYFALNLTMNDEEAQDLLQETYLKALTYKDKFIESTNLKAWLYTIMKNTFINNYRRAIKTKSVVDVSKDLTQVHIPQSKGFVSPDSSYTLKEITSQIDQLSDEYKIPLNMHFEGFKYKEIAEQLNVPIGTVKSRIFLARKELMKKLKDFR